MKKIFKVAVIVIATLLFAALLLWALGYSYIFRGLQVVYLKGHTTAYIDDHPEFANRFIEAGEAPQPWPVHKEYSNTSSTSGLEKINKELGTVAFLIIKKDSIWYENYAEGYDENSLTNSFSMAKSITTALLGKAIKDGYIKSLDQPVKDFLPEFSSPYNTSLTVGDLSSMASGLNWNEDYYNPFAQTARAYFDSDIRQLVYNLEITSPPGKEFEYLSGNTLMLGMVLEKATGQTLSGYLSESFWKPLGMQNDALWQLDSEESGLEKAYCCIASNARDFARFGKLFKNYGRWNGKQILDSTFVATATRPRFEDSPQYGYGFWLSDYKEKETFYMRGVLGQYVIVIPEDDLIIVRLGHNLIKREESEDHAPDFFMYIDETYKMLTNAT
ncbi:serine hydrolase [Antarcticibacterium flavum]|uniref:Serine hydrolase n=1 Tax=Antarcticibacterium flavum TaxID=2058175 RepID=A0A5B7X339_9FLAO|nr:MULTISPECIES: serine hydrolase [Antarcticibacterium]MCM4160180.1 serine hydrolase [Antarcticibacterium sp. W02-3]QCY69729.1 serine hydrolase [Antarcticibacterium flavum]